MKHKSLPILVLSFIFILLYTTHALAIGVQPLAENFLLKPGAATEFKISLLPEEKPVEVQLSICKPTQMLNGELSYEVADPVKFVPAKWVSIPSKINLTPGLKQDVMGTIKVPFDATGVYIVAIMVEPVQEKVPNKVTTLVRYAVRLRIKIDRPGNRPEAAVTFFDMVKGDHGEPVVAAQVKNNSPLDFITSASITIRDSNRRLVERVPLLTGGLNEVPMLPFSELRYLGNPNEVLTPGEYEIRLFYSYASSRQIILAKNITVKAGDYVYSPSKLKIVKVMPQELEFVGRSGATSMKAIKLENKYAQTVNISLEALDIEPKYPFSILTNTELEIIGDLSFTLEPHQMSTHIVTVKFKNIPSQENYGIIKVKVFSTDKEPKLLEESTITMMATIPGKYNYAAQVTNLTGDRDKEKYVLSAIIVNKGNIKISPTATAIITDSKGKVVETVDLGREVTDQNYVIPEKQIILTGLASNLKPGTYKAKVNVTSDANDLGTFLLDLDLK